jgi:N utilization substance protein B
LSINIIIKEYLNSSNFFLEDAQTKYLNALLDNIGKKLRTTNAWIWINKKIFFKIIKKE